MDELFFLAAMVLGWALGCGLLYILLRWLSLSFALAVRCTGAWALVVWVPVYASVGWTWLLHTQEPCPF